MFFAPPPTQPFGEQPPAANSGVELVAGSPMKTEEDQAKEQEKDTVAKTEVAEYRSRREKG